MKVIEKSGNKSTKRDWNLINSSVQGTTQQTTPKTTSTRNWDNIYQKSGIETPKVETKEVKTTKKEPSKITKFFAGIGASPLGDKVRKDLNKVLAFGSGFGKGSNIEGALKMQPSIETLPAARATALPFVNIVDKVQEPKFKDNPEIQKELNKSKTLGNFSGNVAKNLAAYYALGPAIEAIPALGAISNPALRTISTEAVKDLAIGTPISVMDSLNSGLKGDALKKSIKNNLLLDIGTNLGGFALGKVFKGLKKSKLPVETPEIKPQTAIKEVTPTKTVNDLVSEKNRISKLYDNYVKQGKTYEANAARDVLATLDDEILKQAPKSVQSEVKFVSGDKGNKKSFKDTLNNFYTRTVDINHPIKKINDKTYTLATNSKNVGGSIDFIMKEGLANQEGKVIGKSLKQVVEDIPKGQESEFWNYMGHRHNIDRASLEKPVFPDFDSTSSSNAVKQIELQHPEWKEKADNVVKFINDFMEEWGHRSGLISDETWGNLKKMYPNYFPTHRSFNELEEGISNVFTNSKGFINQSSPVKSASGSGRDIINPVENIMNLVNSTVRKARYNQVGQGLVEAIQKNPTELKKFAEIVTDNTDGNNVVKVLVQGNPIYVKINDKPLLESLEGLYKASGDQVDNFFRKITNNYKQLITQKNPVFSIRNIARDLPTAYINGSESNPIKFVSDLISAGKDLVKNTDVAKQYKALGGASSGFFNIDKPYKSAKELTNTGLLKKIGNGIETFNSLTESAPRLSQFKRTLNKTGDVQKALYDAGDITVNFAKYGDVIKKIDSYVPYLNSGAQGLDKLFRQFKDKPIATILKGATAITAPTLILYEVNKNNPNYKQLDQRTKDNYYLIPNGETFIKIPKSRELGVLFGSLTERILNQAAGQENAFKGYINTVKTNFSPTNPFESNIASPLIQNLQTNKDFAGRSIVPGNMKDRSPKYQYDESTSEIGKKIGEIANLSPKQVDYLIKSYTGVIGQLALPATTKKNYASGNPLEKVLQPITTQFIADPLYSNSALTDFYDNYDKLKRTAADSNFTNNIPSKIVTKDERLRNEFAKVSKQISNISKLIKEAEKNNDQSKIRELRKIMIELATKTNEKIK